MSEENNLNNSNNKKSFWKKLKLYQKIIIIVIAIIAISIIFSVINADKAIDIVKNGEFFQYKGTTVSKAFENFFSRPKWSSYKDKEYTIVEFKGNALYDNKDVEILIEFNVDTKTGEFDVDTYKIDNNSYNIDVFLELLDTIYKDYP